MLLKLHRVGLISLIAVSLCVVLVASALAADTAADLLKQAIQQMDTGQYTEAQQTLHRIDRVQLDDTQRQQYDDAVKSVAAMAQAQSSLDKAVAAEKAGKLDDAKQMYRQLTADTAAPRKIRSEALNGLARVERALMGGQTTTTMPAPQPVAQPQPVAAAQPAAPVEPPASAAAQPAAAPAPAVTAARTAPVVAPAQPAQPKANTDAAAMLAQAKMLEAQRLVAEADNASQAGRYNDALKLYQQAIAIDSTNKAAQTGAENVKAVLARETGGGVLREQIGDYQIRRQQTLARYDEAIANAQKALAAGNYPTATDDAALAKSILDTNRDYLPEAEYLAKRQAALDLAESVSATAEKSRVNALQQQQATLREKADAERIATEASRQKKVQELLHQARDLSRDQKYDQALSTIQQIKFMDPNNVAADYMEQLITDQKLASSYAKVTQLQRRELARQRVDNLENTVPYNDLLTYPSDWPEISYRRLNGQDQATDSETNRVAREKLQQPIPVDFRANQLGNVIEYLHNVTGANFVVQWRSLEAVGITRETPVTMQQLTNVAADHVLKLILEEVGGEIKLDYTIDDGIVVIATADALAAKTEIRTYDIRDLIVQPPDFNQAPTFDLQAVATDQGKGGGGQSIFKTDTTDEVTVPRADRITEIEDKIKSLVAPESWRPVGLTSSMDELNGTLLINTTVNNHLAIAKLLRQLREQRALQIAVDARFLFVTQNFLEEVGFDVDFTWNGDSPSWIVGNPTIQQSSAGNSSTTTAGGTTTTTSVGAAAQGTSVSGTLAPLTDAPSLLFGALASDGSVGGLGFIIDDLRVNVLLRATEKDVRNITVNTPRLTFFNGERANIVISRQTAFVSDLEAVVATNAVAFNPTISVVSDGVVLDVQGTISADRRYVTLILRPSLAQLVDLKDFAVNASSNSTDNNGAATGSTFAQGTLQQPEIALTQVSTTVSIPDKGTLLIGGQRLVGDMEVEQGVPVLSRIPIVNRLFTNRATTHDERTLLILVKPTIIVQAEEEERLFPGLNQAPGLYNLGVRP